MKQEQVDAAMEVASGTLHSRCLTATVVTDFLTALIDQKPGWLVRQALRTARGFVVQWQLRHRCR